VMVYGPVIIRKLRRKQAHRAMQ